MKNTNKNCLWTLPVLFVVLSLLLTSCVSQPVQNTASSLPSPAVTESTGISNTSQDVVLYPSFTTIPTGIGIAIDDVGWQEGSDLSSVGGPYRYGTDRGATLDDYQTVVNAAKAAGTRPVAAFIMSELDRSNICAKPEYNQPIAPSDMTEFGLAWDNSKYVNDGNFAIMNLVRDNAANIEFSMHGVRHEHWSNGQFMRAEFAKVNEVPNKVFLDKAVSWGWNDMNAKASCFQELMRQYYDVSVSSFPKSFVPPDHGYFYEEGNSQTTGALLHTYGIKYANGDTNIYAKMGNGGIDNGVLFMNRMGGAQWDSIGVVPNRYPSLGDGYAWIESHFPNWWGSEDIWTIYMKGVNNSPVQYLAKNTAQCASQWLYKKYANIAGDNGTYTIDNTGMTDDAYKYDLLSTLVLKTPLNGKHISSASIDGDAQIAGYYEDSLGYGYLVIGSSSGTMGRLSKQKYTIRCKLGDSYMPTYADISDTTYNLYSLDVSSDKAVIRLELYGTQDIKIKLPFKPGKVTSSNPDITIKSFDNSGGFVTIKVSGKNIEGEEGAIYVSI